MRILFICINQAIRAVQRSDYNLSCDTLKYELANLGSKFEESKDVQVLQEKLLEWTYCFGREFCLMSPAPARIRAQQTIGLVT